MKFSLRNTVLPFAVIFASVLGMEAATRSTKTLVVAKWDRFEASFMSSAKYTNAIQQATLTVRFVSPAGETNIVPGFWDGDRTWRARFMPGTVGRWTYFTKCSDTANTGLHAQSGEFLCSAAKNKTRFNRHGPIQVAIKGTHLEHADYTPFFWAGESAAEAVRRSALKDLEFHARVRSSQKFNAILWTLWPGLDKAGQPAFTGRENISVSPAFFQRLDAKVDVLNRAGLLNAIVPLWEIGVNQEGTLPEDQAILLLRYAIARWGGNDVAWVLGFEGGNVGKPVDRWQRIGRAVFDGITHAPVILLPGETSWVLNEFRHEQWLGAFGSQTAHLLDENSLQWFFTGPITMERQKKPARPLVTLLPPVENATGSEPGNLANTDKARRLLWWSALVNTPAGVSYSSQAVANQDSNVDPKDSDFPADWPASRKGLFLPGARHLEALTDVFNTIGFRRLQPMPQCIAVQPGNESPQRFVAAAGTQERDLLLVYVPEDRSVTLAVSALPASPSVTWINPRTGERHKAVAVVGQTTCQFPTPEPGDWVLLIKAGR